MIVAGSASPLLLSSAGGYNLTKSLRFRSSASAYLNRTLASSGSLRAWTWSAWVKRGTLGVQQDLFGWVDLSGGNFQQVIGFNSDNTLEFQMYNSALGGYVNRKTTTQVFRDPSAWYHIVVTWDSNNATADDRARIYINGTRVTAWANNTNPSLNQDSYINNSSYPLGIGRCMPSSSNYFDGYLTEVNFVNAQALTPSSFGQTSPTTGVWQPIKYTGTYGTNGFYLPFTDVATTSGSNAGLGKDFSGNGNYWTTNNISVTSGSTYDSMKDVPTLTDTDTANYSVINPLQNGGLTITNGNLTWAGASSSVKCATGSIAMTSGKWYFEALITGSSGGNWYAGVCNLSPTLTSAPSTTATGWGLVTGGGGTVLYKSNNNVLTSLSSSSVTGSVVSFAIDVDAGKIWFAQNGTWLEGSPSAGTGASYTNLTGTQVPYVAGYDSNDQGSINFGQRPFAYTPPSGFKALNTFNLPTPTIGATASTTANEYFDATTYTGTGSSLSITNSGAMQPDLVWIKIRNQAYDHTLVDAVRGTSKDLESNTTDAEQTRSTVTAFNSNGFTVGTDSQVNSNGNTFVAWQWKESVSAGFDILTYTGNGGTGASSQYVNHNLGVTPKMIITKVRSSGATYPDWYVYHSAVQSGNFAYYGLLNSTAAWSSGSSPYQLWTANSTQIAFNETANESGKNYVAYCFAQVAGYSAFGSYVGNGNADGPFIYTGFRPRYYILKNITSGQSWSVQDTARSPYNVGSAVLFPNSSSAELTGTDFVDILSNGFKIRHSSSGNNNNNGDTYIYMAFAENPFKYANAR